MASATDPAGTSDELVRDVAFVFVLDPTVSQAAQLARTAGVSRFCFNQGLALARQRQATKRWLGYQFAPSVAKHAPSLNYRNRLLPAFNAWRKAEQARGKYLWLDDVSKFVREEALVDVARAFENRRGSNDGTRKGRKVGPPRFKKKGRSVESFRIRQESKADGITSGIRFADPGDDTRRIYVPSLGWLKIASNPRKVRRMVAKGRFKVSSVTVSLRHGRWQISVAGKATAFHTNRRTATKRHAPRGRATVGVDLGVRTQAVAATADGQVVVEREGVKAYGTQLRKLRRASRAYARTKRGSKGREKAAAKLARIHARVVGLRRNALHQLTTELATSHDVLVVEDLDVAAMLRSGRGARGVADQTFGEFRRQLTYKADWYGTELVVADRWYASSKTCSACGQRNGELGRGRTAWVCPDCGVKHDRDVNAAVNLARWPTLELTTAT